MFERITNKGITAEWKVLILKENDWFLCVCWGIMNEKLLSFEFLWYF